MGLIFLEVCRFVVFAPSICDALCGASSGKVLVCRELLSWSCCDRWGEFCFLFCTCVGGNYSVDSGTNQSAGVFKNVFFPGFSVRMWGLVLGCCRHVATHGGDRSCRVLWHSSVKKKLWPFVVGSFLGCSPSSFVHDLKIHLYS